MTDSMELEVAPTTFKEMFDFFLAGITDDMFMEMTKEDTLEILEEILLAALPHFEFPKEKDLFSAYYMKKTELIDGKNKPVSQNNRDNLNNSYKEIMLKT